jgi:hypothetical protein
MSWRLLLWLQLIAMAIIAIVDYLMGEVAQTLNGYEILRRTFAEPIGISLHKVAVPGYLLLNWLWPR